MTTSTNEDSLIFRASNWVSRHWLAVLNGLIGLYVLLPFVAPMLMANGITRPAAAIYRIYSPTCHQMAFRSVFIGGEQVVYPREHAETLADLTSFEEYAQHLEEFHGSSLDGLGSDLMLAARGFNGNEQMGFKTAICQRDLAIFGALFIGGLIFAGLHKRIRIRPMPLWLFVLLGMGPIGFDGFSQLFSYYIPALAFRESPPFMRIGTGLIFGFAAAWLIFPYLANSGRKKVEE